MLSFIMHADLTFLSSAVGFFPRETTFQQCLSWLNDVVNPVLSDLWKNPLVHCQERSSLATKRTSLCGTGKVDPWTLAMEHLTARRCSGLVSHAGVVLNRSHACWILTFTQKANSGHHHFLEWVEIRYLSTYGPFDQHLPLSGCGASPWKAGWYPLFASVLDQPFTVCGGATPTLFVTVLHNYVVAMPVYHSQTWLDICGIVKFPCLDFSISFTDFSGQSSILLARIVPVQAMFCFGFLFLFLFFFLAETVN